MTDYTIMVRNLPETCTEKDLIDHFSGLYALNRIDWRERSPLPGTKPVDTSVHAEVVGTWVADCVVFYAIGRLLSSFKKHQALLGDHHIHLPSQHIPSLLVPSLLCTLLHTLSYSYLTNVVTFPSLTTPHPLPTPSPFSPLPLLTPPLLTTPHPLPLLTTPHPPPSHRPLHTLLHRRVSSSGSRVFDVQRRHPTHQRCLIPPHLLPINIYLPSTIYPSTLYYVPYNGDVVSDISMVPYPLATSFTCYLLTYIYPLLTTLQW